jgi:transcriptional regulator with XRE-family HTH domain
MKRKNVTEKYSGEELVESFIFRNRLSALEEKQVANDIAAARAKLKAQGKDHSLRFKLLQLKYQMEDSVNSPFKVHSSFGYFLKKYVDILNLKRYQFADEISIDATYLSQLINRHRSPSEEIIIRLELHSRNLINALTWFKLVEKEKENEIETDKSMRQKEKKYVKGMVELT